MTFKRKTLSVVLCFLLLITTVFPCFNVSANTGFAIKGGSAVTTAGGTAEVAVDLVNNPGCSGINIYYEYDTEYFTLTSAVNEIDHFNMTHGRTTVWDAVSNYSSDGTLATLNFEVAEDIPEGDYPVQIHIIEVVNEDIEELNPVTVEGTITVAPVQMTDIEVTKLPTKLTYLEGKETLDISGGEITAYFNDGSEVIIPLTDDMVSGFNNTAPGKCVITVTYEEFSATFDVVITEKQISSIEITSLPDKLIYLEGKDDLDVSGGEITLYYDNDTYEVINIEVSMISGFDNTVVGNQTLTVNYNGFSDTYSVEIDEKTPISISVTKLPDKLTYLEGKDSLDVTGGEITLYYNNDTFDVIAMTDEMVSGFDNTVVGNLTLTISYGGFSTPLMVDIAAKSIASIEVTKTPDKVYFLEGKDALDVSGGEITVYYNNGTSQVMSIEESMVSGFDNTIVGNQTLTVSFGGCSDTYSVEIVAKTLISISVTKLPNKLVYLEGKDSLDVTGGQITLYYDNNTSEVIAITDKMVSGFDVNILGQQEITVTYGKFSDTFSVEVSAKQIVSVSVSKLPEKLTYLEGKDALNVAGGEITVYYDNNTSDIVLITDGMVKGFDNAVVGKQTLTVTYSGFDATFEIEIEAKSLSSVKVTKLPEKLTYLEAKDALDVSGGQITLYYNNDTSEVIDIEESMVSGFNNTVVGVKTLTVSYGGFSDTYNIEIAAKALAGIKITKMPDKVSFLEAKDKLDVSGGEITVFYNNDTKEVISITESMVSGFDNTVVGSRTLTVSFGGFSDTYSVQIIAKTLVSISIVSPPHKTVYNAGEEFDTSGLIVTAYYDNDTTENVTDYQISGYTDTVGIKTITVSYNGKTDSFNVTVKAVAPEKADTPSVTRYETNSLEISWKHIEGVAGYRVYNATNGDYKYVTSNTYTFGALSPATEYTIYVRAYVVDVDGNYVYGDNCTALVVKTAPAKAATPKATVNSESEIVVEWGSVPSVDGYEVRNITDDITSKIEGNSYFATDLLAAKEYAFAIRSYVVNGDEIVCGEWSNVITLKTAPAAVSGITFAERTDNTITIEWNEVDGAEGYRVLNTTNGDYGYVSGTSYTFYDLNAASVYKFTIRAYIKNGTTTVYGVANQEVAFKTTPAKMSAPSLTADGTNKLNVSWSAVTGADGYTVLNETTGESLKVNGTSCSFSEGIEAGKQYSIKISAYFEEENNIVSGAWSAAAKCKSQPAKTENVIFETVGTDFVEVVWDAVDGADGYRVLNNTTGKYALVTDTNYTFTGLTAAKQYNITIRAYVKNPSGNVYGETSAPLYVKTAPQKMANPTATAVSTDTIKVAWSAVQGADGYSIRNSTTGSITDVTDLTAEISKLSAGTAYTISVRAYVNNAGIVTYGEWSNAVVIKTIPAKVENAGISAYGTNALEVSWDAVNGAAGYRVYNATTGVYKYVVGTEYSFTGLTPATKYNIYVRAYVKNGSETVYGENCAVITVRTTPGKMATPTVEATGTDQVTVSWGAVAGADIYRVYNVTTGKIIQTTSLSCVFTGLSAGDAYAFNMRAIINNPDTTVYGALSNNVSVKTVPDKTENLISNGYSETSLDLTWDKVNGAVGYRVLNTTTGAYKYVATNTYTFTGLNANTEYGFTVRAYVKNGSVTVYGETSEKVVAKTCPAKMATPTVSATSTSELKVSWNKVSGVDGYRVYNKTTGEIIQTTNLSCVISALSAGKSYTLYLRSYVAYGDTVLYGPWSSGIVVSTVPAQVKNVKVSTYGTTTLSVTFDKVEGAVGYRVYNSVTGAYKYVASNTCTFTGLTAGTAYNIYVRAYVKNGTTTVYGDNSVVLKTATKPNAATVTLTAGTNRFVAKWSKVSGANGYEVEYALNSTFTSGKKSASTTAVSYTASGLTKGKTYYVRVRSYKTVGTTKIYSSWSTVKSVKSN